MRYLVRFGYDGRGYHGWARQPGHRTIEGTIADELRRRRLAPGDAPRSLDVASRTDRGVSARANAVALHSPLAGAPLLRALNGIAPDIFFTAVRPIDARFRPRSAVERWYRYFEPSAGHHLATWRATARRFVGPIDVRSLGRGLPADTPMRRTVSSLAVDVEGDHFVIDVKAPSFVWGMVRRIIAALRAVDDGSLTSAELDQALAGERRLTLPLAEPEPLVLWEVVYDDPWPRSPVRRSDRQRAHLDAAERSARLGLELVRSLRT